MSASRARRIPVAIVFCLSLFLGLAAPAAGADQPPKPSSMAAAGDSITRAFNLCFFPFTDCLARSWSTGNNTSVNSHARRLGITASAYNDAKSGAKMSDLPGQAATVSNRNVGYVTVLMGGNDVCTDTETQMTDPGFYATDFIRAMDTLKAATTPPLVYVVSIPNVKMLWETLWDNSSARSAWSSYNICQSLLANPLSTAQVDVDRRERVKQRNMELNQRLRTACASYTFCRFDGEASFGTAFVPNDVSTRDYFHPSTAGQTKLASVSYDNGYWGTKGVNGAPTPAFTASCLSLTCTFTDQSSDPQGIGGRSWNFDGLATSVVQNPSHTFVAAGVYNVTMYAIDRLGATARTTQTITVSDGSGGRSGTLAGTVTAESGGAAIVGATVTIGGTAFFDVTDSGGVYSIAGVTTGSYSVTASATGHADVSQPATITEDATTVLNFQLTASGGEVSTMRVADLDGSAQVKGKSSKWEASVTVTVQDGSGAPVEGAAVTGTWSGATTGSVSGSTASNGTVTFSTGTLSGGTSVTFTVDNVVKGGFEYQSETNTETSISILK